MVVVFGNAMFDMSGCVHAVVVLGRSIFDSSGSTAAVVARGVRAAPGPFFASWLQGRVSQIQVPGSRNLDPESWILEFKT